MLVVFSPIFVDGMKIIFRYGFAAPLKPFSYHLHDTERNLKLHILVNSIPTKEICSNIINLV